jgi:hypothetical protein
VTRSTRAVRSDDDQPSALAAVDIRWLHGRKRALPIYAMAFMAVLLYLALGEGQFQGQHRAIMGAAAMLLGYFVLVHAVNGTRVAVRGGSLWVEHGPLPWRGRVWMPLSEVERLTVERTTARIRLRTRVGEDVVLLDDLAPAACDEIEKALEELPLDHAKAPSNELADEPPAPAAEQEPSEPS